MKAITNNEYRLNQKIELSNGFKGTVISICSYGNKDIRPPYHKNGIPTLKAIYPNLGYIQLIPDTWEVLYSNEVNESEIINN